MKLRPNEAFGQFKNTITFVDTDEAMAAFELLLAAIAQPRVRDARVLDLAEAFRREAFRATGEQETP